jgi:hypothetical protein
MNSARFLVAVLVLAGAVLAACSGNFGSGTTPPNGLLPSGNLSGLSPTPTPTPNSASNIVTYGDSTTFQPLPNAAGWGGAIAFPAAPSPKPSGFDAVAIGATVAVVAPTDAPDLNLLSKGKNAKKRDRRARALVYITLLPTHDATLSEFPRIAIDVPRDIVVAYHLEDFGLALYNAGAKDTAYRLDVAVLDSATPPPTPSPPPTAPPPPTAIPLSASPLASGATPVATPTVAGPPSPTPSPTLPPQRIAFAATAETLKLTANRPVVFAFYALPKPQASGSPAAGTATAGATGSPEPALTPTGSPAPART